MVPASSSDSTMVTVAATRDTQEAPALGGDDGIDFGACGRQQQRAGMARKRCTGTATETITWCGH